jgi:Ca-activated chloride channel family protein
LNLPAGWDFDVLFHGARAPGADGEADAHAEQQIASLDLPQTATNGPMLVVIGLGMLALGGLLGAGGWVLSDRRRAA